MKQVFNTLLLCCCTVSLLKAQSPDVYEEKVTSAGNVAATISNLGIIGNSFSGSFNVLGYPSCEYPAGSGVEHVFEGGLWVGGVVNGQVAVSTAAVDDATGYSPGKGGFEFSSKNGLREASSLFDSPFYSPGATSHQDFVSSFTDTSLFLNTGRGLIPIQGHLTPLGLKVDFESYNWNFAFANFFVILNFKITNLNTVPIDSLFFGYWIDGVIRNVNITPPGGTAFFNKGGNGYIDSLNMCYEFDAIGDIGFTDSYVATKFLGAELNGECVQNPGFKVHFNTWQFRNTSDPLYFFPEIDVQKYGKMSNGLNHLADWPNIERAISTANNRSNLLTAGPVRRLNPGEEVELAFAIVCARRVLDGQPAAANTVAQRANLVLNANWAQTAYFGEDANANCILDSGEDRDGDGKITRFILPSPPDAPRMRVVANDNQIDLFWTNNAERSIDPISKRRDFEGYRLYKTALGFDIQDVQNLSRQLQLVGSWDKKGNGLFFDNGFNAIRLPQPVYFEGDTVPYWYKYSFRNIANGWQHVIALTAFDEGDEVNRLESLESAPLNNLRRVFAGKPANASFENGEPFVYPNPYYAGAAWEGQSIFQEDKKLYFANLPARCEVRVYTLSGDIVDIFTHEAAAYQGQGSRWFSTYSNPAETVFSGGEHAWDLLSRDNQILARGLYLFVITDLDSGIQKSGKFVIIK